MTYLRSYFVRDSLLRASSPTPTSPPATSCSTILYRRPDGGGAESRNIDHTNELTMVR